MFDLSFWGSIEFAGGFCFTAYPAVYETYFPLHAPDDDDDAAASPCTHPFSEKCHADLGLSHHARNPSFCSAASDPSVVATATADTSSSGAFVRQALCGPDIIAARLANPATRAVDFRREVCAETEITVEIGPRAPGSPSSAGTW